MNGHQISPKTVGCKIREVFTTPIRYLYSLLMAAATTFSVGVATYCADFNTSLDAEQIFGNMAEIIIKIAFYVGALVTAGGVFQLILAYKDDNADGQTRAVRLIVVGIVLVGFRTILSLSGLIK